MWPRTAAQIGRGLLSRSFLDEPVCLFSQARQDAGGVGGPLCS